MHRTLLKASPAASAAVIIKSVAQPGPSLITASSGHAPRHPSHSQQFPHDRHLCASNVACLRRQSADHLLEARDARGRLELGLTTTGGITEVPEVQHLERNQQVLRRALQLSCRAATRGSPARRVCRVPRRPSPCARLAPCPRRRTRPGNRSSATRTRGRCRRARTPPPGTACRNAVSVSWPSAKITVSAASVSNRPVGCGNPDSSSSITSTCSCGPSNALIVRSQLIRTPSCSASCASCSCAGICSRVRR